MQGISKRETQSIGDEMNEVNGLIIIALLSVIAVFSGMSFGFLCKIYLHLRFYSQGR